MKIITYIILATFVLGGLFLIFTPSLPSVTPTQPSAGMVDFVVDTEVTPPSLPSGPPPAVTMASWKLLRDESGVRLYQEQGISLKSFLLIADPAVAKISVINDLSYLPNHWRLAQNPVCVFNGTFFEPGGAPTFPLILNGTLVPGFKTDQFPTRMMYFGQGISVADVTTNADVAQSAWGIGGLNPSFYDNDRTSTTYNLLAEKDGYLFILITQNRSLAKAVSVLTDNLGVDARNIVSLDPGWSVQFRCFGTDYLTSPSIIGSSLVISAP